MHITHSLLAFHADFSFLALPIFELKWSVFLSPTCLRKVHTYLPSGGSKALISWHPLDSVHPMP